MTNSIRVEHEGGYNVKLSRFRISYTKTDGYKIRAAVTYTSPDGSFKPTTIVVWGNGDSAMVAGEVFDRNVLYEGQTLLYGEAWAKAIVYEYFDVK